MILGYGLTYVTSVIVDTYVSREVPFERGTFFVLSLVCCFQLLFT